MSKLSKNIWPNGIKEDAEGYSVFYPLGTNKIDIPTSSTQWPKGNKLISPFVYDEDDILVGFVDTKALVVSENTTIYLPYTHIKADFSAIDKGQLQIHAPKAITKKASWKDSGVEDIPEAQFKYKGCSTIDNVKTVDANYKTTDIVDGVWSEPLWDLEDNNPTNSANGGMFFTCTNLTTFTSDLSSLTNGSSMFYNCSNLTTFTSDLSSLTNGYEMFQRCSGLTTFTSDLSSLTNGYGMFRICSNLTTFTSDSSGSPVNLSSLTDAIYMFASCNNLTTFNSDLSSLTNGVQMFRDCSNLTTFNSDLSSLTDGSDMFYNCSNLTIFNSDLSSLTNGYDMFYKCSKLTIFTSDLSSLTNGVQMFRDCSNLTTFNSDLSSLTNGVQMFNSCKLNTASVQNIADTINTYNGKINIGIGNSTPNTEETEAFNKMVAKGWTVYVMGNGGNESQWNPTSLIPIDGEEISTPIPFYAKPVQATEETATYTDEQGNYYNILGGQFIYGDDLSAYGVFTCEEDAAANMRLTKIEKGDK